MSENAYYPGQQVILQGEFKSTDAAAVDPTIVTLLYRNPLGTVTSKTNADLTNSATGTWRYLLTPTSSEVGMWRWGMRGEGAAIAADLSGQFRVLEPEVST